MLRSAEAYLAYGRHATLANIHRGLWQRPVRGVVVTHNGPLDPGTVELVALASGQNGAALGGLTALAHDGLDGFPANAIHLVVPDRARRPSMAGLDVHWSQFLDDRDIHPAARPRRTRVARSVIDAASWTPHRHRRYARAIVIAAIQQGLTTTRHVREALARRGKCRHRALIVQSVLDAAGGIQSLPERDLKAIILELGWQVSHQKAVRVPSGRFYLDAHIAELDLSIEVHGIPHMAVRRWDQDLLRANEIVIRGNRLLIFSSYAIRHERAAVIDQLRRFAASRAA